MQTVKKRKTNNCGAFKFQKEFKRRKVSAPALCEYILYFYFIWDILSVIPLIKYFCSFNKTVLLKVLWKFHDLLTVTFKANINLFFNLCISGTRKNYLHGSQHHG